MSGPDNGQSAPRPISVAELLAKNGSIGSRPVGGGRRRRRRGSDSVTVAELTGEIPVVDVSEGDFADGGELPDDLAVANGGSEVHFRDDLHPLERADDPLPRRGRDAAPERGYDPRVRRDERSSDAESMSPDPVDDDDDMVIVESAEAAESTMHDADGYDGAVPDELGIGEASHLQDDLQDEALDSADADIDEAEPLSDDLSDLIADADGEEALDEVDLTDAFAEDAEGEYFTYYDYSGEPTRGQRIVHGLVVVGQSVLAVAFGAGLFLAFDQLWQWNSLVAMVLAILVTLGLVAGVWVVRKTEDIGSTLIAVGVGLLVTFGPLAIMHAT